MGYRKDQVLAAASIPIYRVTARQAYDPLVLSRDIDRLITHPRPHPRDE